jgi:para-aminobenzoate synthetase component I
MGGSAPLLELRGTENAFPAIRTIRTFAIAEGRTHLWVGGGIVWDSDSGAEIDESWTKARPLLEAIWSRIDVSATAR